MRIFFLVFLLVVSACGPTYQESRQKLATSANPYEVCLAAGDNRVFSDQRKRAAIEIVRQRNYQCDWQAVSSYWERFMSNSMTGLSNSLQLMQQGQWQTPQAFQGSTSPAGNYNSLTGTTVHQNGAITQQGAGNLVSQSTMNGMRYCYYNKLGSITSIAISTTQMCPLSN